MDFKKKPILGILHLYGQEQASDYADDEVTIFEKEGVDGFIIENYGGSIDRVREVLRWIEECDDVLYKGINILPNDFERAYAYAAVYNLDFIQLDYIAGKYKHGASSVQLDVGHYNRFRDKFPEIKILGGVHPKGYVPVEGSDLQVDIEDAKERCDAIVVTGIGTGKETPIEKIIEFRKYTKDFPLIIGAGLNSSNVVEQIAHADGAIVGSCFKRHNQTKNPVNQELVKEFMAEVNKYRVKTLL